MAETKLWEYTDEQISAAITMCHEKFIKSTSAEDAKEWKEIETMFLREQRERMELMLKDETDACEKSQDQNRFNFEKEKWERETETETKKSKVGTILKIGEIVIGILGAGASVASSVLNYKAKKYEFDKKVEAWDRACTFEESGNIPLQAANKLIKF